MPEPPSLIFLSNQDFEKSTIYVDSREVASKIGKKIIEKLNEFGTGVITRKLDFGDYLLGEKVVVERKTVFDLVGTLTQRFLFDQIFKMKKPTLAS